MSNYFLITVRSEIFKDASISGEAVRIYGYILNFNFAEGACDLSNHDIANALSLEPEEVHKHVNDLIKKEWLTTEWIHGDRWLFVTESSDLLHEQRTNYVGIIEGDKSYFEGELLQ